MTELYKLVNECFASFLLESSSRIQHAEDLIFWEGSSGAIRAIKGLVDSTKGGNKNLTVKWDGSPAVIFGRNEHGQFIFTDKNGFGAKGYDGKSKSPRELETMLLNRGGTKPEDKSVEFKRFARNMSDIFHVIQRSVPDNFRGFFKGDLLYMDTPTVKDDTFVFKPNVVTYEVPITSPLGIKISKSKVGIVVHAHIDLTGKEARPDGLNILKEGELLVMPPVTVETAVPIDTDKIRDVLSFVKSNGRSIDELLDKQILVKKKLVDLPDILYTYINSKVDSGMSDLGADFFKWLGDNGKITSQKKKNVAEHITSNQGGFNSIWTVVSKIISIKDEIVTRLEQNPSVVKATIGGKPGGEGYVLSNPEGSIKLVSRSGFSAANRSAVRESSNINEGGNVFKSKDGSLSTKRISLVDILPTIKWLEGVTKLDLLNNTLGTTGKQSSSGDLDISVDESGMSKESLVKILSDWCNGNNVSPKDFIKKSGDSVHFKTPILGNPTNGFVQTDFMFGDPTWMKWSLSGGKSNSKYKGVYRHILLASIAKYKNLKWSYKSGLVNRETGETITKNPNEIAEILLGKGSTGADLDYFENIIDKIKNKPDFENMVSDARQTLIKHGIEF